MPLNLHFELKAADRCPDCDAEDWRTLLTNAGRKDGRQIVSRQCGTCERIQWRCTTGHWVTLEPQRPGYCASCRELRRRHGVKEDR
jgi:hypothetical protein